jgi:hypothetical protein
LRVESEKIKNKEIINIKINNIPQNPGPIPNGRGRGRGKIIKI